MTALIYKNDIMDAAKGSWDSAILTGGEGLNLLNGLTYNSWKPNAVGSSQIYCSFNLPVAIDVDFFAFDGHNLDDIDFSGIFLHGSTDAAFTSTDVLATITKAEIIAGANIKHFTSANYQFYRIWMTHATTFATAPIISVLSVGERLELPEGIRPSYTPPRVARKSDVLNNKSNSGNPIGRSLKRSRLEFNIKNELIAPAWIRANWDDLVKYIEVNTFFYLWNDLYPDDGVLAWTKGNIKPPVYTTANYMKFDFKCNGYQ